MALAYRGKLRISCSRTVKCYSSGLDLCPCSLLSCLQSWELQGNVQVKAQWAHVWWCTPGEGFSWLLSARTWFMCWTMGWLGVREKPSQGSMCVHCEERRGDWETSYRQGKRISNSVGLLPLAAGCLWCKKLCCFSLVFVPCLSSFPQCSCFYTSLTCLMTEVTKLNLLCCAVELWFSLSASSSYLVF